MTKVFFTIVIMGAWLYAIGSFAASFTALAN
jgi:hypothetical protein